MTKIKETPKKIIDRDIDDAFKIVLHLLRAIEQRDTTSQATLSKLLKARLRDLIDAKKINPLNR